MYTFLIILGIIVAILLIVVVFLQNPKSDSTGPIAGGSSQILSASQTADFFEKTTWTLVIALFVIALISGIFLNTSTNSKPKSLLEQKLQEQGATGNAPAPIKELENVINNKDNGSK